MPGVAFRLEDRLARVSMIEIGLQAARAGQFRTARRVFRAAMSEGNGRLGELATYIARTFLAECDYSRSSLWFQRALEIFEVTERAETVQAATVLAELADISAARGDIENFQRHFDKVQSVYLCAPCAPSEHLRATLCDLSWTLAVRRQPILAAQVHAFIGCIDHQTSLFRQTGATNMAEAALKNQDIAESRMSMLVEVGKQSAARGDFHAARSSFRRAMHQLANRELRNAHLSNLAAHIAQTHLEERRLERAAVWFGRALKISELAKGPHTLEGACIVAKVAEVMVLSQDLQAYRECFQRLSRSYLLMADVDALALRNNLVDLVWTLCVRRHAAEAKEVNDLISSIDQLNAEIS